MGLGITGIVESAVDLFFPGLISWQNTRTTRKYTAKGISFSILKNTYTLTDDKTGYVFPAGTIRVNVKKQETHKFSNTITSQTMEDGSEIADHVINNPIELTLQFEETNTASLSGIYDTITSLTKGEEPIGIFEKLKLLWEYKIPLTITTEHYRYTDMQIENMPISHVSPYKGALQVVVDLKKMQYSKIKKFTYKSSNEATNKSASETTAGGMQKTIPFDAKSFFLR